MAVSQKQRAYEALRGMILRGELVPGDRLSDFVLSKKIGISRPPIREAIGRLESESLVEQVPHYGTFVRRLDARELDELYELRELMESHAAARAAERATAQELSELQDLLQQMHAMVRQQRNDAENDHDVQAIEAWVQCDIAFHLAVVRMSRLTFVPKIISDFRLLTAICGGNCAPPAEAVLRRKATTWGEHTRIYRALVRRDPDAAHQAMRKHLHGARRKARASDQATGTSSAAITPWPDTVRDLLKRMERYASEPR